MVKLKYLSRLFLMEKGKAVKNHVNLREGRVKSKEGAGE